LLLAPGCRISALDQKAFHHQKSPS
jgi:hypothetical protein